MRKAVNATVLLVLALARPAAAADLVNENILLAMPPVEWLCSGHGPAVTKDVKKKLLALGTEKAD